MHVHLHSHAIYYIFIHIYMYCYVWHVLMHVKNHLQIHMHVSIYTCTFTCTFVPARGCPFKHICMYVRRSKCAWTCVHAHGEHTYTHIHINMRLHAYMCMQRRLNAGLQSVGATFAASVSAWSGQRALRHMTGPFSQCVHDFLCLHATKSCSPAHCRLGSLSLPPHNYVYVCAQVFERL